MNLLKLSGSRKYLCRRALLEYEAEHRYHRVGLTSSEYQIPVVVCDLNELTGWICTVDRRKNHSSSIGAECSIEISLLLEVAPNRLATDQIFKAKAYLDYSIRYGRENDDTNAGTRELVDPGGNTWENKVNHVSGARYKGEFWNNKFCPKNPKFWTDENVVRILNDDTLPVADDMQAHQSRIPPPEKGTNMLSPNKALPIFTWPKQRYGINLIFKTSIIENMGIAYIRKREIRYGGVTNYLPE